MLTGSGHSIANTENKWKDKKAKAGNPQQKKPLLPNFQRAK
jgi:hypothetical protein